MVINTAQSSSALLRYEGVLGKGSPKTNKKKSWNFMGGGSFQLMKKIETFREKNVQIEIFSYLFYIFEKL